MLNTVAAMITIFLFLSFLVERLVEWVVRLVPPLADVEIKYVNLQMVLAVLFSLILAFGAKLDFFVMMGIPFFWPYVGIILTAIVMSGGSNFVHDIIGWVEAQKDKTKEEAAATWMYYNVVDECDVRSKDEELFGKKKTRYTDFKNKIDHTD